MARRKTPSTRPDLALAFAMGALAGAAATLTLRRRSRRGAGFAADTSGFHDDADPAALDGRFDTHAPNPVGAPVAVEQG